MNDSIERCKREHMSHGFYRVTDVDARHVPDDVAAHFADIARQCWDPRTGERGLWSLWQNVRGSL